MISVVIQFEDKVSAPAASAADALQSVKGAAGEAQASAASMSGALGGAASGFGGLFSSIVPTIDVMQLATAAWNGFKSAIGTLAELGELAMSVSDFKGDMQDIYAALLGSEKAGAETYAKVEAIAMQVPLTNERVQKLAKELLSSGLGAGQLEASIKSIADIQTVMGDTAAAKVQKIIDKAATSGKFKVDARQLVGSGLTQAELADALGMSPKAFDAAMKAGTISAGKGIDALNRAVAKKFGGLAGKQMLDFDVQIVKAKDALKALFADVDAGPFLAALHDVLSVFDQNTASGKLLKSIVTGAFNAIFVAASKVLPYVKAAFYGIVIGALKLYIAIKPAIAALGELFGAGADITVDDVVNGLAIAIESLAPIIKFCIANFISLVQTVQFVASATSAQWNMVVGVFQAGYAAIAAVFSDPMGIATSFVQGLVNGFVSGTGMLVDAIRAMGSAAISAIKGVLGIASPSRVMAEVGGHTAEGFAQGVEDGSDRAAGAVEGLGDARPGGGGSSTSRSITVNVGGIVIQGAGRGAEEITEEAVSMLFERMALSQGLLAP